MKKRFLAIFLASLTFLMMFSIYSFAEDLPTGSLPRTTEDCSYKLGRLNRLEDEQNALINASYNNALRKGEELIRYIGFDINTANAKHGSVVYDDAATMLLGLRRGDFQLSYVPTSLGRYIAARNDDINIVEIDNDVVQQLAKEKGFTFNAGSKEEFLTITVGQNEPYLVGTMGNLSYRMATLPDRAELCGMLNNAIQTLKEEGTLTQLEKTYIEDIINGKDPEPVEIEMHDGWDTIRIAVTGDLPPMDYAAADGTPAGFNVALLSAVSEKIGYNIELVPMNTGSRLINMTSGLVDAIFWVATPEDEKQDNSGESGKEISDIIFTDPYYTTSQCFLYTDYPLEYILEFEFYQVPEDRKEEIYDMAYWALALTHFDDNIDKSTVWSYQPMIDYLKETKGLISDDEIDEFLHPYLEYVPWFRAGIDAPVNKRSISTY